MGLTSAAQVFDPLASFQTGMPLFPAGMTLETSDDWDRDVVAMPAEAFVAVAKELLAASPQIAGKVFDGKSAYELLRTYSKDLGGREIWYYEKSINGKLYIILKGRVGLRTVFKSSKYLAEGKQAVNFARLGIGTKALRGFKFPIFQFLVVGTLDVLGWLVNDEAVMSDLIVILAIDAAKLAIGAAVVDLAAWAVFAAAGATGVSVGVITVGGVLLLVGITTGLVLDWADNRWQVTTSVQATIKDWSSRPPAKQKAYLTDGYVLYNDPAHLLK